MSDKVSLIWDDIIWCFKKSFEFIVIQTNGKVRNHDIWMFIENGMQIIYMTYSNINNNRW